MRCRFSSDIVKTLPIYYVMLLEYVCKVSKLFDYPESEKIFIERRVEKEVKPGILYATRKLNYIFQHSK